MPAPAPHHATGVPSDDPAPSQPTGRPPGAELLECDLIMKGGVTSGVVYPPAVIALSRTYRFRSIGGASAGAIAAGATAAAEFARGSGGFERLGRTSAWLSGEGNLISLFQPTAQTAPLLDAVLLLLRSRQRGRGRLQGTFDLVSTLVRTGFRALITPSSWAGRRKGLIYGAGVAFVIGVIAAAIVGLLFRGVVDWQTLLLVALVHALLVGLVGVVLGGLVDLIAGLPWQGFGICPGLTRRPGDPLALTEWLTREINTIAGLPPDGPPLTFAQLADHHVGDLPKAIDLKLITTNLSHGRPYVFPHESSLRTRFLFDEAELKAYVPPSVLTAMVAAAPTDADLTLPPGVHFLPGKELPIVVAMRLSLSFPLLLSAVPLHVIPEAVRHRRRDMSPDVPLDRKTDLQRCWFSDGGITSNFPIHFFDRWLPSRPTFGIKLTPFPADAFVDQEDRGLLKPEVVATLEDLGMLEAGRADVSDLTRSVYLPPADRRPVETVSPVEGLGGFAMAIFRAAQNYRDNTQSRLPSYRDRIVEVRLRDDEGGLNLGMAPEVIAAMAMKGTAAGEELAGKFKLDHHQWVRFLVLMRTLEENLDGLSELGLEQSYSDLIGRFDADFPYTDARDDEWRAQAVNRLHDLLDLVEKWQAADAARRQTSGGVPRRTFFSVGAPSPNPVLRVTPPD